MAKYDPESMIKFYELCKEKNYVNMRDAKQSLKAKVIATDLGLKYGDIEAFYEKAKSFYEKKQEEDALAERRSLIEGTELFILQGKHSLVVYRREDGSVYTTLNKGPKVEGNPVIKVLSSSTFSYTYHPSQAVFTGASSGGIAMGGVHHTQAYTTESHRKTGNGYIEVTVGGESFSVSKISVSSKMRTLYKRDAVYNKYAKNGVIACENKTESSKYLLDLAFSSGNYQKAMSIGSMALDQMRLPYVDCVEIANLIGRMMDGYCPPTDEELYIEAERLCAGSSSASVNRGIEIYKSLIDYKDSKEKIRTAELRLEDVIQEEKEQAVLKKEKRLKLLKRILIIVLAVYLLFFFIWGIKHHIEQQRKNDQLMENILTIVSEVSEEYGMDSRFLRYVKFNDYNDRLIYVEIEDFQYLSSEEKGDFCNQLVWGAYDYDILPMHIEYDKKPRSIEDNYGGALIIVSGGVEYSFTDIFLWCGEHIDANIIYRF